MGQMLDFCDLERETGLRIFFRQLLARTSGAKSKVEKGDPIGLENRPSPAYGPVMDAVADKTPPGWLVESLERSEAQIASGQTVPLEPVLNRLRASIARMTTRQQAEPKTAREA